jgi:endonuclease/exonuclease/phosphatase (EEP) superfamily protein YafD
LIRWLSWLYLVVAVLSWATVYFGDDQWWLGTMVLFGPRWLLLLPLAVLVPLAAWQDRRLLVPLLLGALIVLGPFMGLQLHRELAAPDNQPRLRVLTCNIDGKHANVKLLHALIAETDADIVALQEFAGDLKNVVPPSWHLLRKEELVIFSRYPLRKLDAVRSHPNMLASVVRSTMGDITFCTVHLPSTRFGLTNLVDRHTLVRPERNGLLLQQTSERRQAAEEAQQAIAALKLPVIVAGDFNTLVESPIYREFWHGYRNAFSTRGFGYGWTERARIQGIRNVVRIDHVLMSNDLKALSCRVGSDIGSDHLPVIAEIVYDKTIGEAVKN